MYRNIYTITNNIISTYSYVMKNGAFDESFYPR